MPPPATADVATAIPPQHDYYPGLDGLRAVAMVVMLSYHAEFEWARGAFLGISQFFTLSGFLITTVLLRRHAEHNSIDLRSFWRRRYRRLLPGAYLALLLILAFGVFAANAQQLENLPGQTAAAVAQLANWYFIATDASYIDLFASPSPVQHFWSLAIEEQFYLVMPLLVVLVLRRTNSLRTLALVFGGGAVVSALWTIWLLDSGASLDRLYYGTDTRAAELLVGALLAVVLFRFPLRNNGRGRIALIVAGIAGFALTAWGWFNISIADEFMYRGGLPLFAVISAVVIAAILTPRSPLSTAFSWGPLPAMGRITYGLYLFHWPLFLWINEERTGLSEWPLFAVRMLVTFAMAIASYHLVEMPMRRGGMLGVRGPLRVVIAPACALLLIAGAMVVSTRDATDPLDALAAPPQQSPIVTLDGPLQVLVIAQEPEGELIREIVAQVDGDEDVDITFASPFRCDGVSDEPSTTCTNWVTEWPTLIDTVDPDVVLLEAASWEGPSAPPDANPSAEMWIEGVLSEGIDLLTARGAPVVWVSLTPDVATALQRDNDPLQIAMGRLTGSRPDLRSVIARLIPDEGESEEAWATREAGRVLDDLRLYRRGLAGSGPRVLVVGDSTARTLGYGLEIWGTENEEAVIWNTAIEGCGLADAGLVSEMEFREQEVAPRCVAATDEWPVQVQEFQPEVVVVLSSVWDLRERRLPNWDGYRGPGDPEFDDHLLAAYEDAVDTLSAGGAQVVWMEPPCARSPSAPGTASVSQTGPFDPRRLTHLLDELLPRLADARPEVQFFDLYSVLCPDGEFLETVDGVGRIRPDGVHFSADGAVWFAENYGAAILEAGLG